MVRLSCLRCVLVFVLTFHAGKCAIAQTSPSDYFRSASSGSWNAVLSWESSADGVTNWMASSLVPTTAANTITIRNSHTIFINSNVLTDQVIITNGGILELATTSSTALTINDDAGSDIIVQSGGIFRHKVASGSQLPSFSASATLEIKSGGILEAANNNGSPSDYANTASAISSHVLWGDSSIFNWNNTSSPANGITYFPATASIPVFRFSAPASIGGTSPTVINGLLDANAKVSFSSTGAKTIRNGIIGIDTVAATSASAGQFIINGTTAKLGGGILILSDNGMNIASATVITLLSNKTISKVSNPGLINLSGTLICNDYIIDGNCKIQIDGTVKTTNVNGLTGGTNTTFATGFTVNALGSASTIEYNRAGDQTVTALSYNNLTISGNGSKNAATGADVQVSGILNIASANTLTLNGVNHLKLNGGGTVNVNTNAVFDNGGESQVSGTSMPVINIYGTFITRDADGFTGNLTSIPGATSTTPTIALNIYGGSTIEYGRAGNQDVTSRNDYKNMTFSGSGIKTLATFSPNGTVTIKDNAIADAANKTFGDSTTNLTMTGGRFKVAGSSTKPDIAGTYTLTAGVIEFAGGTASVRQNIRSSPTYINIEVTGPNVGNSNSSTKLANGGSFTVKTGGSYENSGDKIDGTTGSQTFTMEAGSIFKTGMAGGFSGSSAAALYNIETIVVDSKSTIIYSRAADQTITPLPAGYPALLLKGSGIKTVAAGTVDIATAADSVVIDSLVILKVSSGAKMNLNNRPVFIHSSAGSTGMIGEITNGSAALLNATNITAERFIPARRAFRFLSSAVTTANSIKSNWMEGQNNPPPAYSINNNNKPGYGTHITGSANPADGFDATATNNPSLFSFNNGTQTWQPVANTNGNLAVGNGYRILVRGSRSVDLSNNSATPSSTIVRSTGTIITGSVTYSQNSSPSINATLNYYSLIGNPYASSVNWDALTKPGLSLYYTVWDPNLNTRGAYATYGNGITNPANSKVNQNLQSQQAFFVQAKSANPSITFSETSKTTLNTKVFRQSFSAPKLSVQLLSDTVSNMENTADGVIAFFDSDFNSSVADEDALKISNLDENLAIVRNGIALSIEGRPVITADDTLLLSLSQLKKKTYFLKFDAENFSRSVTAFVKDKYLNMQTAINLSSSDLLPFSITNDTASYQADRFIIILKSDKVLPINITKVKAYIKGAGIQVEWFVKTETNIEKYYVEKSTDGNNFEKVQAVVIKDNNGFNKNYTWFDDNANAGNNFYRIKLIEKSGEAKYSNQICVTIDEVNSDIKIYPNPVRGNVISLQLMNVEEGTYEVCIFNNAGIRVFTETINHNGTNTKYSIPLAGVAKPGNYKMKISNSHKTFYKNILINSY